MSDFAARLLHARSVAGITQRELADRVGVSSVQLSRYESGKSTPRPPVLAKLAGGLGVRAQWLANGAEPMEEAGPRSFTVTVAFSDDEYKMLEEAAHQMGLPVNDAILKLAQAGLAREKAQLSERERLEEISPTDLATIKNSIAELRERVEKLAKVDR